MNIRLSRFATGAELLDIAAWHAHKATVAQNEAKRRPFDMDAHRAVQRHTDIARQVYAVAQVRGF